MLTDPPANVAELLSRIDERVDRLENKDRGDTTVRVVRSIEDTELSSDSLTATVETPTEDQFAWGQSEWGRNSW